MAEANDSYTTVARKSLLQLRKCCSPLLLYLHKMFYLRFVAQTTFWWQFSFLLLPRTRLALTNNWQTAEKCHFSYPPGCLTISQPEPQAKAMGGRPMHSRQVLDLFWLVMHVYMEAARELQVNTLTTLLTYVRCAVVLTLKKLTSGNTINNRDNVEALL